MFAKTRFLPVLDLFILLILVITAACAAPTSTSPAATRQPTTAAALSTKPVDTPAPSPTTCVPGYAEPVIIHEYGPGTHPADFAVADFNGDNLADIIVARGSIDYYDEFPEYFFANDGKGGVYNATDEAFEGSVTISQTPREVVTADFNNDGVTDLFIADQGAEVEGPPYPGFQNSLILSAPGGKLVDGTPNLLQQSAFTHSAAAADIDNDGDVDLFVGNWDVSEKPSYLLFNDGSGHFTADYGFLAQVDLTVDSPASSLFADLNNDGFPDLVVGPTQASNNTPILLNEGSGSFSPLPGSIPAYPFSDADYAADIAAGDLDGDGFLDLVISWTKNVEPNGRYLQVLINQGDATFIDETATRIPSQTDMEVINNWFKFIELTDADQDGDLDLLTHPHGHTETVVYENDGSGIFEPSTTLLPIPDFGWYALADFNGDGHKDLVLAVRSVTEGFSAAFAVGLWTACP